jgi:hypothetical protein
MMGVLCEHPRAPFQLVSREKIKIDVFLELRNRLVQIVSILHFNVAENDSTSLIIAYLINQIVAIYICRVANDSQLFYIRYQGLKA